MQTLQDEMGYRDTVCACSEVEVSVNMCHILSHKSLVTCNDVTVAKTGSDIVQLNV